MFEHFTLINSSTSNHTDQAHKQSTAQAAETQALFDQFADTHIKRRTSVHPVDADLGEMSMDLITVPAKDHEKGRLDEMKKQLDEERRKFTEAAVRLGKERAAMEVIAIIRFCDIC